MSLFTSFQLKSRDPETRRRAALKLGVAGRTSSIAALEPLLDDPDWGVRAAAAGALGAVADPAVVPLLLNAVRAADPGQDAGAALRAAVVAGLGRIGAAALPPLLDALRQRDARVREAAIEALGGIGEPESVKALAAALGDDRSNVRQAAAPALARAGREEAIPALRSALSHKDPATRRAAAAALGSIPAAAAAEALRTAAADRDRPVREAALHALTALGSPAAVEVLCSAFLAGDRDLRPLAASALRSFEWEPADARTGAVHAVLHGRYAEAAALGAEALAPLAAALADRDAAARRGAAEALGVLDHPGVVPALAPLLGDPDTSVREAVAASLAGRGPAASVELVRALGDRDAIRDAAAEAIARIGEGLVAEELTRPLLAGRPARHGGLAVRAVAERAALDLARQACDLLGILVARVRGRLPEQALRTLAALDDVMLVEPGQRPDPDGRVACDEIREAARRELTTRGAWTEDAERPGG